MLFDPDAGLTREEAIRRQWESEFAPDLKAAILQRADEWGCTWFDVILHCLDRFAERWNDPIERQRMIAWKARQDCPLGQDPLLKKNT